MEATAITRPWIEEARSPLWFGSFPASWGGVIRGVDPDSVRGAAEMVEAAGLDWMVEQHPLEAVLPVGHRVSVPRFVANVRADTGRVLGVVGGGYRPLQNREAFSFCDAVVDSGEAHWLGGGETRGGARVHGLMRLDREIRIGGLDGENVLPLLCLRNGHDGGLAVTVSVAPFRLACLNGMLLPLEGAERVWRSRHTANLESKLADARRTLEIAWRYYDRLEEEGAALVRQRMSEAEFERFLARLVPLPEWDDPSRGGRVVRNRERVRELIRTAYRSGEDLADVRGTRWGALQAALAYHDHLADVRATAGRSTAEARFERATEPAPLKDRALELLAA